MLMNGVCEFSCDESVLRSNVLIKSNKVYDEIDLSKDVSNE